MACVYLCEGCGDAWHVSICVKGVGMQGMCLMCVKGADGYEVL
jgi:hypothetical protein